MHKEYILLNGFRKAKRGFTAGFHVPLTMQEMIWQCITVTSFASERKQTIHGVVRDNRFSVIRDTLKL